MFKSGKKVLISAVTVGCLFGGSILSNVAIADAAVLQGNAQSIEGLQAGMNSQQSLLDRWFNSGISNLQQPSASQPGQQLNQQSTQQLTQQSSAQPSVQQPGQQFAQQSSQLPAQQSSQLPAGQAGQQQSSFDILSKVASILGVEEQTIKDELQEGNTLVEIAENYDVSESTLLSELETVLENNIDDALTAGTITEDQATEMESQLTERLTQFIESTLNHTNSDTNDSSSDSLSTPDGLTITVKSSSKISLDWDSVDDATSYYVYRTTSSSGTYSKVATVTSSNYTDTGLSADTRYYYKVKAVNSSGTSSYSSIVAATTDED